MFYDSTRRTLLRTAQWGFARKTAPLALLGSLAANPPTSIYPWLFKYEYPSDCLHMRYVLPQAIPQPNQAQVPAVGVLVPPPSFGPNRTNRYLRSYDDTGTPLAPPREVILSNVVSALGVYTVDVTNPDMWDDGFLTAMYHSLAEKVVIPLTGNTGMKETWIKIAEARIMEARAMDGNEAIPSSDVVVDWIVGRNSGGGWSGGLDGGFGWGGDYLGGSMGQCWGGYGSMPWAA
jgi:hypothetical protein